MYVLFLFIYGSWILYRYETHVCAFDMKLEAKLFGEVRVTNRCREGEELEVREMYNVYL